MHVHPARPDAAPAGQARPSLSVPVLVAIPVKDEAERIGPCLRALAGQKGGAADAVILVVNNTRDGSASLVRARTRAALHAARHRARFPARPRLRRAGSAHGDGARRRVGVGPGRGQGVLLTTDADGQVAPDWIRQNLAHLAAGAEAVAGRAVLDPADAALIPARLHDDDARECAYAAVLDEIASLLDPDPWDPLPRHAEHSGASICVTLGAYRRAGGMPAAPLGEDRAFFAALRRVDARIRHAPDVQVAVSGRTQGRAPGGMADTIRRRLAQPDAWLDDALEPAEAAVRRARLRRTLRRVPVTPDIARTLRLPIEAVAAALDAPWFGEAWATLEASSPALARTRVAVADLPGEMARAL